MNFSFATIEDLDNYKSKPYEWDVKPSKEYLLNIISDFIVAGRRIVEVITDYIIAVEKEELDKHGKGILKDFNYYRRHFFMKYNIIKNLVYTDEDIREVNHVYNAFMMNINMFKYYRIDHNCEPDLKRTH